MEPAAPPLTARQEQILAFIRRFHAEHDRPPTTNEVHAWARAAHNARALLEAPMAFEDPRPAKSVRASELATGDAVIEDGRHLVLSATARGGRVRVHFHGGRARSYASQQSVIVLRGEAF